MWIGTQISVWMHWLENLCSGISIYPWCNNLSRDSLWRHSVCKIMQNSYFSWCELSDRLVNKPNPNLPDFSLVLCYFCAVCYCALLCQLNAWNSWEYLANIFYANTSWVKTKELEFVFWPITGNVTQIWNISQFTLSNLNFKIFEFCKCADSELESV